MVLIFGERYEHRVAPCKCNLRGQTGAFRRDGLLDDLDHEFLARLEDARDGAVFVYVGEAFDLGDRRVGFLVDEYGFEKSRIGGELGTEIQIVKKSILLVAHVDEGGVETGHQFLDLGKIDVSDSVGDVARLLLQGDEPRVLKQGNGYLAGLYVYNQFTFHL